MLDKHPIAYRVAVLAAQGMGDEVKYDRYASVEREILSKVQKFQYRGKKLSL